ncbi:bifunctional transcriptional activator/DNA repair enzyme Ada [Drosophila kikkawai]|uniref:Methylated-DNA--protein-cysteine methyltransferase n=1 Tax=Drosophila kikkawai TaxID=30033 RepID=A0A6P4J5I6_DROKI|nr:bifunctional transcriptional activator/DNA repair enzyme Ada [Drosophila kikkawai]
MWFDESPRIRLVPLENPPELIRYSILATKFGRIMMGIVDINKNEDAICLLYFVEKSDKDTLKELGQRWPKSELQQDDNLVQSVANKLFEADKENNEATPIAILGTEFQQSVWSALVGLKSGETCTYSQLAERMGRPKAVRAVANAVAKNEVAILIPCHRIVSQNGATKYHWGSSLKQQLLAFENSLVN